MSGIAGGTVGSNDIKTALRFYDELLAVVGISKLMEHPSGGRVYGVDFERPMLSVVPPFDGKSATAGNGSMLYVRCDTDDQVAAIYGKAINLGGSDEGEPGPRNGGAQFAAYFRDLDGNKICAFHLAGA